MSDMTLEKVNEAGVRDRPLMRHLATIILLKVIFLFLLWFLFFRVPEGAIEPGFDIHNHIAGASSAAVSTQKEVNQ
jgi:hypothetical protein